MVRYCVLLLFCSLAFLTYLDRICIMRVQGDIERDLHLGQLAAHQEAALEAHGQTESAEAHEKLSGDLATRRMSWIFSAFVLGYVLFELPGGWLGDVFGPRKIIFRIVLCWSVFTALTGAVKPLCAALKLNDTKWLLGGMIAVRFLFGLGEAGAYPNISRALGRWFPFQSRGSAQSAIWFASRAGGAFAPLIIGLLLKLTGHWTRAFWVLGIIGCGWAIGFYAWFRDNPEQKRGVNSEELGLIRSTAGDRMKGQPRQIDLAPFAPAPVGIPWRALFSPNLLLLYVVAFTASFSWFFYVTFLPKYLKEQFQVDYSDSQLMTGLPLLIGAVSCLLGGRGSDLLIKCTKSHRWGRSLPGLAGMGLASLCTFSVSAMRSPWQAVVALCLAAAFQDLGLPAMWSAAVDIGGPFAGTVGGCMNACGAMGAMVSPLAAAGLATRFGWNAIFIVFGFSYALGAFAWTRVDASQTLSSAKESSPRAVLSNADL